MIETKLKKTHRISRGVSTIENGLIRNKYYLGRILHIIYRAQHSLIISLHLDLVHMEKKYL